MTRRPFYLAAALAIIGVICLGWGTAHATSFGACLKRHTLPDCWCLTMPEAKAVARLIRWAIPVADELADYTAPVDALPASLVDWAAEQEVGE